jgi:hypothetical protein
LVVARQMDKTREPREHAELSKQLGRAASTASPDAASTSMLGPTTRVWVDEHVREGRRVAGHFETRHLP